MTQVFTPKLRVSQRRPQAYQEQNYLPQIEIFPRTLEQFLQLAKQLYLSYKVRLIKQIATEIQRELPPTDSQPGRSLWGLCADLGTAPSADEIDEVRRDVWGSSVQ